MTSSSLVRYELEGNVATITMDDGKANLMTDRMHGELGAALDRAESDRAIVLLVGRERLFSGGYDKAMFTRPRDEMVRTLRGGAELVLRLLRFPRPVIVACTGHAIAQGAFLMLASDVRVGAAGDFKIGLNEVAIGLTIPHYGVEMARHRLSAPWFDHSTITGTLYPPDDALAAGFLDRLVPHADVVRVAREEAKRLTAIDMAAHHGTKLRVRAPVIEKLRWAIDTELAVS